jgi:hypothetical protein
MQDLIKPSIRLEEDNPMFMARTPSGEGGLALTLETDPRTPAGPSGQAWELRMEIVVITRLPGSGAD